MTTYGQYQCDTCKRTIETEIDPTRPTYTHCNITYKCLGRLKLMATKSVRTQLVTTPVPGLVDWKSRFTTSVQAAAVAPTILVSAETGDDVLTIAVNGVNPLTDELLMTFLTQSSSANSFTQYTYYGFTSPASFVSGVDSTSDGKILRFNTASATPDSVSVNLNGVNLQKAVLAQGHAVIVNGAITQIVVDQEGDLYDTPPTVNIGGNGSGAVAVAVISGGAVTGVTMLAEGNNYSGTVLITFTGGVSTQTVFYLGQNSVSFSPNLPVASIVEVTVTPFTVPITVQLTFARHNLNTASQGAWMNASQVFMSGIIPYDLFSCTSLTALNMGTHVLPQSLTDGTTPLTKWNFLLSQDPHQNVDRLYSSVIVPANAELFRTLNQLGNPDVLIDKTLLTSVFPPAAIIPPRLQPDVIDTTTVSQLDDEQIDTNKFILGLAQ